MDVKRYLSAVWGTFTSITGRKGYEPNYTGGKGGSRAALYLAGGNRQAGTMLAKYRTLGWWPWGFSEKFILGLVSLRGYNDANKCVNKSRRP